ncbi:MAG TPA: hypothetical protein VIQ11_05130 [Mycobacterium sp.]
MEIFGLAVTLAGTALSLIGSWKLFRFRSDDPKFTQDGANLPGERTSTVVPNLIIAQRRPLGFACFGGAVTVVGGAIVAVAAITAL